VSDIQSVSLNSTLDRMRKVEQYIKKEEYP